VTRAREEEPSTLLLSGSQPEREALGSTSAIFVTQAERRHQWTTRGDDDQEGMPPSGIS